MSVEVGKMLNENKLMEVLGYINHYVEENGFPPTVRDMCRDLGIKSTATAYSYINRLKDKDICRRVKAHKFPRRLPHDGLRHHNDILVGKTEPPLNA